MQLVDLLGLFGCLVLLFLTIYLGWKMIKEEDHDL